ncbi:MAG: sensor histidine kinase [Desulfobacterales bacterium]|nr:sensor histidine kinase [Desulfobacterales bacterium]
MVDLYKKHGEKGPTADHEECFYHDIEIEFLIHELKDPIAIIETGARTLLKRREKTGPLTPRQEKTLKRTLRSAKKARQMLYGLLEIGRAEAGCFLRDRFSPVVALRRALLDALETVPGPHSDAIMDFDEIDEGTSFLSKCGIRLDIDPRAANVEIDQDEIKFRQIAGNLIKNALHHRKERVHIVVNQEGGRLLVEVSDDGPGVNPEDRRLVFRRYAQAKDNSGCRRKGHGLGLAGARIMARSLGGDVELIEKKKTGAAFRVTLPLTLEK